MKIKLSYMKYVTVTIFYLVFNLSFGQLNLKMDTHSFQLDNGFTVIVLKNEKVNNITAELYFRAGSRYEKPGQHGFAHLMEHSLRPVRIFSNKNNWPEYAKVFVRSNAQTRTDYTRYHQQVKSNGLEQVLVALSDRANMPSDSLDEKRINKNIKTVINEISNLNNKIWQYDDFIYKTIKQNVYGVEHPYAQIQEIEDILGATPSDMKKWHRSFHNANQAFLLLSGNVDTLGLKPLVEKYFANLSFKNDLALSKVEIPKRNKSKTDVIRFESEKAAIVNYWSIPEWGSLDGEVLRFLHGYLAQRIKSRLNELNLEGNFYGSASLYELAGQFSLGIEFKDFNKRHIYKDLLNNLIANISLESLDEYKKNYFLEEQLSLEDYGFGSHKNKMVVEGVIFKHRLKAYFETLDTILSLNQSELLEILKLWISQNNSYTLIVDNRVFMKSQYPIDYRVMPKVKEEHNMVFPIVASIDKVNAVKLRFIDSEKGLTKLSLAFNPIHSFKNPEILDNFQLNLKTTLNLPNKVSYLVTHGYPIVEIDFNIQDLFDVLSAIEKQFKKPNDKTNNSNSNIASQYDKELDDLVVSKTTRDLLYNQLTSISLNGNFNKKEKEQVIKWVETIDFKTSQVMVSVLENQFGLIKNQNANSNVSNIQGHLFFESKKTLNRLSILLLEELLSVRLNERLRSDLRWTYYVEVEAIFLDQNKFAIKIESELDNVPFTKVKSFLEEELTIDKLKFSQTEIADAKTYLKGGFLRKIDTKSGQNELVVLLENEITQIFEAIDNLNLNDVHSQLKLFKGYSYKRDK